MGQYKDTKAKRAEEELLRQIKLGNYPRGSQLPPTQELARQLDVSHMTIRKVVAKLTADGYLYNISRVGTYINKELPDSKLRYQLGIVLPAYANPYLNETMMELHSVFEESNWLCRFAFVRNWEDLAIQELQNNSDALVFYSICPLPAEDEKIRSFFEKSTKPVVYIGNPNVFAVDTVSFDDEACFRFILETFRRNGHRKIGIVTQKVTDRLVRPANEELFLQIGKTEKWCEIMDFSVECPSFESPAGRVYDYFRKHGAEGCTVLVGGLGLLLPASAALRDQGEDISLFGLTNSHVFQYLRPRVSACDFSLKRQAEQVRELIFRRMKEPESPIKNIKISPQFINGDTLKNIKEITK